MFYYLYRITNKLNGKIYVGVHKTKSLDDDYMGSGKVIRRAIEKYGIENFEKVILETFQSETSMYAREKEVVNEEFLSRDDVYNLRRGGLGGFDHINNNGKHKHFGESHYMFRDSLRATTMGLRCVTLKVGIHSYDYKNCGNIGAKTSQMQTIVSKEKRRITLSNIQHQKGNKNSQFGSIWITNGIDNKKINKNVDIPNGWSKGRNKTK